MTAQTYDWVMVDDGGPMQGHHYCHIENMTSGIYRKPGKRPMYFAVVFSPVYLRSEDRPTIEGAISNLNQKLSAHKEGE